ncbi:MAG: DUF692 family protein [Chloroflexi bacterium]|nr:DUF692 family protein [Chloroflexota bacterium]
MPVQEPSHKPWPCVDGRPLLGANGTEAMRALLAQGGAHLVDYLKVGPFMGREAIAALAPDHALLLHLDDTLSGRDLLPDEAIRRIKNWVELTGTPWTSAHIGFSVADVTLDQALITQPLSDILPREQALGNIARNAHHLAQNLDVPLLLENLPLFPNAAHMFICEPDFVADVIHASGCDLLLDLAHARVSADVLGYEVHDYIERLPLQRVRELHLSSPRPLRQIDPRRQAIVIENARSVADRLVFHAEHLVDVHEPLQEEDYRLLEWTLARTKPQAISLEYFHRPQELREQLLRLAQIIGRAIP